MSDATFAQIEALRTQGLSWSVIGERLGTTKDAARGLYVRELARRGGAGADPAPRPVHPADRSDGPGGNRRDRALPTPPPVPPGPGGGEGYVGFDIGYFDLEASGLNGSFGRLFSGACAHVDGDVWIARIDDPRYRNRRHPSDDSKLAVAIRDHLLAHDILVSWNGKRGMNAKGRSGFDVPMLNARLIQPENGQRIIGRYIKHIDLLKEIRKYVELHSFRLAAVEEFLELAESKNAIIPRYWNRALDGDTAALDYIVEHNVLDVKVLRLVFDAMRRTGLLERPTW